MTYAKEVDLAGLQEFRLAHKSSSSKDGLAPNCKACSKAKQEAKRAAAPTATPSARTAAPATAPLLQQPSHRKSKRQKGAAEVNSTGPTHAQEPLPSDHQPQSSAAGAELPSSSPAAAVGQAAFFRPQSGDADVGNLPDVHRNSIGSMLLGSGVGDMYSNAEDGGRASEGDAAAARDALYASLVSIGLSLVCLALE